jgi:hypothetical protein
MYGTYPPPAGPNLNEMAHGLAVMWAGMGTIQRKIILAAQSLCYGPISEKISTQRLFISKPIIYAATRLDYYIGGKRSDDEVEELSEELDRFWDDLNHDEKETVISLIDGSLSCRSINEHDFQETIPVANPFANPSNNPEVKEFEEI